jgi:hypothetical protein
MKKSTVILFILSFIFLSGCGFRLMKYKRAARNLKSQEISQDEFDQKIYTFRKDYKKDTSGLVKFKGAYVYQDNDGWYRFYKFSKDGKAAGSAKMGNHPNSISMMNKFGGEHCYRISDNNKIELEYFNVHDWNLYNHVKSGYISGDTIFLTEVWTIQSPLLKPKETNVKCVYDSTLTAEPLW